MDTCFYFDNNPLLLYRKKVIINEICFNYNFVKQTKDIIKNNNFDKGIIIIIVFFIVSLLLEQYFYKKINKLNYSFEKYKIYKCVIIFLIISYY